MKSVKNILLLDTDLQSAGEIINTLSLGKDAFAVQHAGGVTEGLTYLQNTSPDLVLLDGNMVEAGNFSAVQTKLHEHNIPCILLSDAGGKNIAGLAEKSGAREYVVKSGITPSYLLKTIVNTLRLSETENRLNVVFEEYSGRISSFSQMLDAFSAGAVVINTAGVIQYTNAIASAMMQDESLNKKLEACLIYRSMQGVELTNLPDEPIVIRTSNIDWNNETCNLVILERTILQTTVKPAVEFTPALLNAVPGNWILLKENMVEFINAGAEAILMQTGTEIKGRAIETLLTIPANRTLADTGGKSLKGMLTLPGNTSAAVKYSLGNLNIDAQAFQLLGFSLANTTQQTDATIDSENMPLPAMGNFGAPAANAIHNIQQMLSSISTGNYTQAIELAGLAETGFDKMGNLLGVFKQYLALNELKPEITEVSMKKLVEEALAGLKTEIDARATEINVSELPVVKADAGLVLRVLQELLNNALAFSRADKKPVIDIGHDKYEGNYIFCIRDNGIGISRNDHAGIFAPFAKLNADNKNNGLGLAVCKSIVEKHGGKIWVESLPGHGSNFYFTLG